ncbi:hypothetical protein FQR65_LT20332 [Abscondita terminalis]|nr:hypothetical protein FQR65_LT20332 [Abscondita terminalis]
MVDQISGGCGSRRGRFVHGFDPLSAGGWLRVRSQIHTARFCWSDSPAGMSLSRSAQRSPRLAVHPKRWPWQARALVPRRHVGRRCRCEHETLKISMARLYAAGAAPERMLAFREVNSFIDEEMIVSLISYKRCFGPDPPGMDTGGTFVVLTDSPHRHAQAHLSWGPGRRSGAPLPAAAETSATQCAKPAHYWPVRVTGCQQSAYDTGGSNRVQCDRGSSWNKTQGSRWPMWLRSISANTATPATNHHNGWASGSAHGLRLSQKTTLVLLNAAPGQYGFRRCLFRTFVDLKRCRLVRRRIECAQGRARRCTAPMPWAGVVTSSPANSEGARSAAASAVPTRAACKAEPEVSSAAWVISTRWINILFTCGVQRERLGPGNERNYRSGITPTSPGGRWKRLWQGAATGQRRVGTDAATPTALPGGSTALYASAKFCTNVFYRTNAFRTVG